MAGRSPTLHEAAFFPASLADVAALRSRLIEEAGASDAIAAGCAMWVLARALGEPDRVDKNTRVRYRKLLALLGPPSPPPDADVQGVVALDPVRRRRRPKRDAAGRVGVVASAVVAAALLAGAGAARSAAPGASGDPAPHRSPSPAPSEPGDANVGAVADSPTRREAPITSLGDDGEAEAA